MGDPLVDTFVKNPAIPGQLDEYRLEKALCFPSTAKRRIRPASSAAYRNSPDEAVRVL
jgi:hypothetical protein